MNVSGCDPAEVKSSLFPLYYKYMCIYIAIPEGWMGVGPSIGICFLGGVPASMYLRDGKVLFISSGCSYYVYSIKHILNMHLIFISIRI